MQVVADPVAFLLGDGLARQGDDLVVGDWQAGRWFKANNYGMWYYVSANIISHQPSLPIGN